ncbi:hypothetical protein KIW74_gp18 [Mycobacterium phage Kimona]|uniref:Uncharacterized protein n=1 Tax=Mycobacterium phage Kimona TaxID=2024295 RepID=A0A249XU51_9CAUD|nr:hypothetical protein KIW74_gp18 [Mycobacterium phage Kimona]ASZ75510.1 hypothetical protein PBI_KIMONA_74 [Mycobacterium phage Kimona]
MGALLIDRDLDRKIEGKRSWIAQLEDALNRAKAQLEELLSVPQEPAEGSVIKFRKFNQAYTFAALRIGDRWFVTQDGSRSSRQGYSPKTWEQLLVWIGERNWSTIEVLS